MVIPDSVRKTLISVVLGAILTGLSALAVNFYVTASNFRATLREENRLRLTRTLNFLLIVRDELARVQENIEKKHLEMAISGRLAVLPHSEWPVQMWLAMRWNADILNIESPLIKLLASIYDDIHHADTLVDRAKRLNENEAFGGQFLELYAEVLEKAGMALLSAKKVREPTSVLQSIIGAYKESKERIAQRLPDVIVGIDIKIRELQNRLGG